MAETLTWRVRATVLRVIDGDTFSAKLDLGWGIFRDETKGASSRVRLLNYNTPEKKQPDWGSAVEALRTALPSGTTVWITSHALDSFGRCLATVHYLDGVALLDKLPAEYRIP